MSEDRWFEVLWNDVEPACWYLDVAGSDAPQTVRAHWKEDPYDVRFEDQTIATARVRDFHISQGWSDGTGDGDIYTVVIVQDVIDAEIWARFPWRARGAGESFYAWDHYGNDMVRDADDGMAFAMLMTWEEVATYVERAETGVEFWDGQPLRK